MDKYIEALHAVMSGVEVQSGGNDIQLSRARGLMHRMLKKVSDDDGKVIFIGNGGSAAIASHMAIDYQKNGGMEAVCYNDLAALTCLANDFGYEHVFARQIGYHATARDMLVAISSSGRSENIINAAETAKRIGVKVVTLTGFDARNPLRKIGWTSFYVPSHDYGFVEISHLTLLHSLVNGK